MTNELEQHSLELLIPANQVNNKIDQVSNRIIRDFAKKRPVVIAIKKGGLVFDQKISNNLQRQNFQFDRGTLGVSSYGIGTTSNGDPHITSALDVVVQDRIVIVNEDIVDTGETMRFVTDLLANAGAASVFINTLLWKPSREKVKVPIYQKCFQIPNKFVVGEGIDWKEYYRELCGIWVVNFALTA